MSTAPDFVGVTSHCGVVPESGAPRAIAGTLVAAFALFGGRWGSHLGVSPLFLTDLLVACAVLHLFATRLRYPDTPALDTDVRRPNPIFALIFLWSLARFALGSRFDLVALRDLVPYLYCVLGVVSAVALARSTQAGRRRTHRVLVAALAAHAVWAFVFMGLFPELSDSLPTVSESVGVTLFQPREDFDTAVVGIFAAYLLARLMIGTRWPAWTAVGLLVCWATILLTESRAGLAGALVAAGLALIVGIRGTAGSARRRTAALAALPLVVAVVALVIPQTRIGDRILGTFGDAANETSAVANGTTEARNRTWSYLLDYSLSNPERAVFGVGFGPNFLTESGAGALLVGTNEESDELPRSPHNYWLGTLLRGGAIAVAMFGALVLLVVVRIREHLVAMTQDRLLLLASLIPVALVVPATLGVILESPFGAVPFFWACGLILAWPDRTTARTTRIEVKTYERHSHPTRKEAF